MGIAALITLFSVLVSCLSLMVTALPVTFEKKKPKEAQTNGNDIDKILQANQGQENISVMMPAIEEFATLTCVHFIPRTTETNYISIEPQEGCWSSIGRAGGAQTVSLEPGMCTYHSVIQHELNHALGFVHEHCRSDRDDYIIIRNDFISPENQGNFDKLDTNNLDSPYDYNSVMHYGNYVGSNTTGEPSMVAIVNASMKLGGADGLNMNDIIKIHRLYHCRPSCVNVHSGLSGQLASSNYPSLYSNNINCLWMIRSTYSKLYLKFDDFDVQWTSSCSKDYIRIYDGPNKSFPLLMDRRCGSTLPPALISSSKHLLVEFITDRYKVRTGFHASYESVNCGGMFTSPNQNFTSPNYPETYPPNMDCRWLITAPENYKVALTIQTFNVEYEDNCAYDYLAVYDGNSPTIYINKPFCGDSLSSQVISPMISSHQSLLLVFHSDYSTEEAGFLATYNFEPVVLFRCEYPLHIEMPPVKGDI
ncbi:embryonic protein UVS.2-like [Gastrophryne carolinensis]